MLAAAVLVADQLSKTIVTTLVDYGARHEWLPVLNIVHFLNTGAAFSLLHDAGGWQRLLFVVIALAASSFLAVMIRRASTTPAERAAFGLVLGGALANMVDRIWRGAVVDWIDLHWGPHHWPAFNVADVGISVGVAAILFCEVVGRPRSRESHG